jgi:hypothetical protein
VCLLGLFCLGVWAASGCQQTAVQGVPRATPPPGFSIDTVSPSVVLAYAQRLEFDSTPGAADEQRLVTDPQCDSTKALKASQARAAHIGAAVRKVLSDSTLQLLMGCTVGPRVRIDPEIGAYRIGEAGVQEGRIIARMVNLEPIAYPKLNLQPRGTTYWWVDRKTRSYYVSADTTIAMVRDTLVYHKEPEYVRWRQAIARFLVVDKDDKTWTACDSLYCCNTSPR